MRAVDETYVIYKARRWIHRLKLFQLPQRVWIKIVSISCLNEKFSTLLFSHVSAHNWALSDSDALKTFCKDGRSRGGRSLYSNSIEQGNNPLLMIKRYLCELSCGTDSLLSPFQNNDYLVYVQRLKKTLEIKAQEFEKLRLHFLVDEGLQLLFPERNGLIKDYF